MKKLRVLFTVKVSKNLFEPNPLVETDDGLTKSVDL